MAAQTIKSARVRPDQAISSDAGAAGGSTWSVKSDRPETPTLDDDLDHSGATENNTQGRALGMLEELPTRLPSASATPTTDATETLLGDVVRHSNVGAAGTIPDGGSVTVDVRVQAWVAADDVAVFVRRVRFTRDGGTTAAYVESGYSDLSGSSLTTATTDVRATAGHVPQVFVTGEVATTVRWVCDWVAGPPEVF